MTLLAEGELQSLSAEVARLKQEHATQAEGFAAKERDWHKEASRREDGLTQELLGMSLLPLLPALAYFFWTPTFSSFNMRKTGAAGVCSQPVARS